MPVHEDELELHHFGSGQRTRHAYFALMRLFRYEPGLSRVPFNSVFTPD